MGVVVGVGVGVTVAVGLGDGVGVTVGVGVVVCDGLGVTVGVGVGVGVGEVGPDQTGAVGAVPEMHRPVSEYVAPASALAHVGVVTVSVEPDRVAVPFHSEVTVALLGSVAPTDVIRIDWVPVLRTASRPHQPPFHTESVMTSAVAVPEPVGLGVGVAVGVGVGVAVGVGVGGGVSVGVGVGLGVLPPTYGMASRRCSAASNAILSACTVVQSSFRTPPVSPEFGFHDQNVQLIPVRPR